VERRSLLKLLSGACLAAVAGRSIAQSRTLHRIAFLHPGKEARNRPLFDAFRKGLRDLGYVEGRDVAFELRWAETLSERLPALAAEVVALKPDVIVTATSAGVGAMKKATSTIPIVFATAGSPVEQGFIASLQRPGGNVTGVIVYSALTQKLLEIAREALPAARRLGMLINESDPATRNALAGFEANLQRLKFEPVLVRTSRVEDFDRAFEELRVRRADILILPQLSLFASHRSELIQRSLKARLPLFSGYHDFSAAGGLLSYGTSREENYRRTAALVDKILRGAKPGELPVEQPERFELVVNRKTAKLIGVELSPLTMLRADRLID
jgi:putative tryptophan/tyrosine transport system substrate-binding protein